MFFWVFSSSVGDMGGGTESITTLIGVEPGFMRTLAVSLVLSFGCSGLSECCIGLERSDKRAAKEETRVPRRPKMSIEELARIGYEAALQESRRRLDLGASFGTHGPFALLPKDEKDAWIAAAVAIRARTALDPGRGRATRPTLTSCDKSWPR